MGADFDLWGNGVALGNQVPATLWPVMPVYYPAVAAPASQGFYAGYFADRQSRFYLRTIRRGGVYLGDLAPVVLWTGDDNSWEWGDGFCS